MKIAAELACGRSVTMFPVRPAYCAILLVQWRDYD